MKTSRMKRVLKFVTGLAACLFLGYVAIILSALWDFRARTVSLAAQPLELRDDSAAFRLARAGLQQLGYDPDHYTPRPFWGGVLCGRNQLNPDFGSFALSPLSGLPTANDPGLSVRLEQSGTTVTCSVSRAK